MHALEKRLRDSAETLRRLAVYIERDEEFNSIYTCIELGRLVLAKKFPDDLFNEYKEIFIGPRGLFDWYGDYCHTTTYPDDTEYSLAERNAVRILCLLFYAEMLEDEARAFAKSRKKTAPLTSPVESVP